MNYENRVSLFIDILGFREIVKSTLDNVGNDDKNRIEKVYEIFKAIKTLLRYWNKSAPKDKSPRNL